MLRFTLIKQFVVKENFKVGVYLLETEKMNNVKSASEVFGILSVKNGKKLSILQMDYHFKKAIVAGNYLRNNSTFKYIK